MATIRSDAIGFYETWLKKTRELYAGQGMFGDPSSTWTTRGALKKQFGKLSKHTCFIKTYRHHMIACGWVSN